jgi:hypothetical protein
MQHNANIPNPTSREGRKDGILKGWIKNRKGQEMWKEWFELYRNANRLVGPIANIFIMDET